MGAHVYGKFWEHQKPCLMRSLGTWLAQLEGLTSQSLSRGVTAWGKPAGPALPCFLLSIPALLS